MGFEVEMKDFGAAMKILGIEIFRDKEKELFLSHKVYVNKVLIRFVMSSGEPISILFTANVHLTMYLVRPVGASCPSGQLADNEQLALVEHLITEGVWFVIATHLVRKDI